MIEIYIDGASAGDPGLSGAGIYIRNNGKTDSFSIPLGVMNNHEAEFHSLIKSLEICIERGYAIVSVRSDSTAVVDAVEKEFARNEKYRLLLNEALSLASQLDLFFIKWIPSKENKHADQLARQGIRLN
ncbi:reverse transcriptase-like protein [Lederbergia panacisoli]|uniref:reverse transcriptase-like protein n=1 Tax=Lederbergia panacisoli TaxID=1255251 RepID=UPI00214C23AE|nr:reverse transcriptase-like protein [Lederbergia panacisoli]MCR2820181.1 reverse transcriptase-like protein [Lederbergia panacisoli]